MHVLAELQRLSKKVDCLDSKVSSLNIEVARRGGLYGAITAAIVSLVGMLLR